MAQLPDQSQFGDYGEWPGRDVLDSGGERLGAVREIYLDQETGRPEWVLVDVEGDEARFVPLADAEIEASAIRVAHASSVVRSGPSIGSEPRIDVSQERRLYAHYGLGYSEEESGSGLPAPDAPETSSWSAAAPVAEPAGDAPAPAALEPVTEAAEGPADPQPAATPLTIAVSTPPAPVAEPAAPSAPVAEPGPPPPPFSPPPPEPSGGPLAVLKSRPGRIAGAVAVAALLFLIMRRLR